MNSRNKLLFIFSSLIIPESVLQHQQIQLTICVNNVIGDRHLIIKNESNKTDSKFYDGRDSRDSSTPGYNFWRTDTGEPNYLDTSKCTTFGTSYSPSNKWYTKSCDQKTNIFVCNRPIIYEYHEYDDFIGIQSLFTVSWTDANKICQDEFDTTLASIHSESDNNQVQAAIGGSTNNYNGWIGLYESDGTYSYQFEWLDETIFNYNTIL